MAIAALAAKETIHLLNEALQGCLHAGLIISQDLNHAGEIADAFRKFSKIALGAALHKSLDDHCVGKGVGPHLECVKPFFGCFVARIGHGVDVLIFVWHLDVCQRRARIRVVT